MIATRRTLATASMLAGLAALAALALLQPIDRAMAQGAAAASVASPLSLPDMALGPAKAPVTIVEYASMSCPHCAGFEQNVFPMLKSQYIDAGRVRFVLREFPLDIKALAASILARCIAGGDPGKYFEAIDALFKAQDRLMEHTKDTLQLIGSRRP